MTLIVYHRIVINTLSYNFLESLKIFHHRGQSYLKFSKFKLPLYHFDRISLNFAESCIFAC